MARIERVVYRTGFVGRLADVERLPVIPIEAPHLSDDVLSLLDHHLLDLGTYGDPSADDRIPALLRREGEAGTIRSSLRSMGVPRHAGLPTSRHLHVLAVPDTPATGGAVGKGDTGVQLRPFTN